MNNKFKLGLILYLLLTYTSAYGNDEICTGYLKSKTPEVTLKNLKSDANPAAQFCVAAMYYKGIGVKKDRSQALKWIQKSAAQGYAPAQTNLGLSYFTGEGVKLDQVEAYKLFLKAAQQNYAWAQYYLGEAHLEGNGIDKNTIEAIKWFKKAADQQIKEIKRQVQPYKSSQKHLAGRKRLVILKECCSFSMIQEDRTPMNHISLDKQISSTI